MVILVISTQIKNLVENFNFSKSYIKTKQLIHETNQLNNDFYIYRHAVNEKNFVKTLVEQAQFIRLLLDVLKMV